MNEIMSIINNIEHYACLIDVVVENEDNSL